MSESRDFAALADDEHRATTRKLRQLLTIERRIITALPLCLTEQALRDVAMYLACELEDEEASTEFFRLTEYDQGEAVRSGYAHMQRELKLATAVKSFELAADALDDNAPMVDAPLTPYGPEEIDDLREIADRADEMSPFVVKRLIATLDHICSLYFGRIK